MYIYIYIYTHIYTPTHIYVFRGLAPRRRRGRPGAARGAGARYNKLYDMNHVILYHIISDPFASPKTLPEGPRAREERARRAVSSRAVATRPKAPRFEALWS